MKKILSIIISAVMMFAFSGQIVSAEEACPAYTMNDAFYIQIALELVDQVYASIFEYHTAELMTNQEKVLDIVEKIGHDMTQDWAEIVITEYQPETVFSGIWESEMGGPKMSDELREQLMSDHSVGEVLKGAAMQDMKIDEVAAISTVNTGRIFPSETMENEVEVFLMNPEKDYNCMVSFFKLDDYTSAAMIQPFSVKKIAEIQGYLEHSGCTMRSLPAPKGFDLEADITVPADVIDDDIMLENAGAAADKLMTKLQSDEYLAAVGVMDDITDLCVLINKEMENGKGTPSMFKIDTRNVWEEMYRLADSSSDDVPEEYAAAVEFMMNSPVVENLSASYTASTAGMELLALSSMVSAYDYEVVSEVPEKESAVIYPLGDKYEILVSIHRAGDNIIEYVSKVVPTGFEEMLSQIEKGEMHF